MGKLTFELQNNFTAKIMSSKLNQLQCKIILMIKRLSWDCNKDTAYIHSFSIIADYLVDDRSNVRKAFKYLTDNKVLTQHSLLVFGINDKFNEWQIDSETDNKAEILSFLVHENLSDVEHKPSNRQISNSKRTTMGVTDTSINNDVWGYSEPPLWVTDTSIVGNRYLHTGVIDTSIDAVDVSDFNEPEIPNKVLREDLNKIKKDKQRTFNANNKVTIAHSDHDRLPTLSTQELEAVRLINKRCGTTWNGGIGTAHYATLQKIASYPKEILQRSVEKLRPEQRPPAMLNYLLTIMQNDNGKVTLTEDERVAKQREVDIQYCRDLALMYRGGENEYYDSGMISGFGKQILKYFDQYGDGFDELIGITRNEIEIGDENV